MLTRGIPPDFRGDVHLFTYTVTRDRFSPEFIGSRNLRDVDVHCRESVGTGSVIFKVV